MNDKVKSVLLASDEKGDIYYEVGKDGITKIEEWDYSPEPYCCKWYCDIYKDKNKIARMDHFSLITYFKE